MRTHKRSPLIVLTVCLISIGILSFSDPVSAKRITSLRQAAKTATAAVKNADVTEVDSDYEKGQLIYEIQLIKGAKKYDITYRASDGKMLSYGWEIYRPQQGSKKKIMNRSNCQKLALKEVPGAKILSLVQKSDDGIPIYKVKLTHSNKKYTLEYHARTGKLLEYEWELTVSTQKKPNDQQIYRRRQSQEDRPGQSAECDHRKGRIRSRRRCTGLRDRADQRRNGIRYKDPRKIRQDIGI